MNDSQTTDKGTSSAATTEIKKDVGPKKVVWEVRSQNGDIRSYTEEGDIVDAIFKGDITPDQESRHLGAPDQTGKRTETKWKRVSDSLARSTFAVRVLFQPVWAHTVSGAGFGAALGIICWLASGVFLFVIQGVNFAAGVVFAVFLCSWSQVFMPKRLQARMEGFIGKVFIAALIALGFVAYHMGLGQTMKGVFLVGFQGQLGAHLAGAIAGVFPGMIVGTLVGLCRHGSLRRAPTAQPENLVSVAIKGLIIPGIILACLIGLCIRFTPTLEFAAGSLRNMKQ